jgi:hypothetical protein
MFFKFWAKSGSESLTFVRDGAGTVVSVTVRIEGGVIQAKRIN